MPGLSFWPQVSPDRNNHGPRLSTCRKEHTDSNQPLDHVSRPRTSGSAARGGAPPRRSPARIESQRRQMADRFPRRGRVPRTMFLSGLSRRLPRRLERAHVSVPGSRREGFGVDRQVDGSAGDPRLSVQSLRSCLICMSRPRAHQCSSTGSGDVPARERRRQAFRARIDVSAVKAR